MLIVKKIFLYLWIPLNLLAESYTVYNLLNFDLYIPKRLEFISTLKISSSFFTFINDESVISFKKLQNNQNLSKLTQELVSRFANSEIIAKNGFHLILKKTTKIQPSLKNVGCLEKKWNQCIEIINHYYYKEEVFLKVVLIKSFSLLELQNKIFQILKVEPLFVFNSHRETKNSNKKYLIFYIHFVFFETPDSKFLTILSTPEEFYYKNEFNIQHLLSVTNIIPKTLNIKPHRDDFELKHNFDSPNLLFAIDNSYTMKNRLILLKNIINNIINLSKDFGLGIKIGILTTEDCKLKVPFTSDIETITKSEIFKIRNQYYESCMHQVEKFLTDSKCNENQSYNRLSILCITDKSDSYFLLNKKIFNIRNNHFLKNKIPFYSIIPLNTKGTLGDCIGETGKSNVQGSYENFEEAIKNSINYNILADETNAFTSSICSSYYDDYLRKVIFSLLAKYSGYSLSKIPIPNTIRIWINEQEIDLFDYNQLVYFDEAENKVIIKNHFSKNSELKIEYLTFDY